MVRLKQVEKNGDIIVCTAYVEDCKEGIQVEYNIKEHTILSDPLPKGYEYCTSHIRYIRNALSDAAESGEIPPEGLIMWY